MRRLDGDNGPKAPLARLADEGLSILVLLGNEEVYRSYLTGVRPLLELVDWFPGGLEGAVVADRIVGGCAARVFAFLNVKKVLGLTGSISAERTLHAYGISYEFRLTLPEIRNRDNSDTCPFEKLSAEHEDPHELLDAVRRKLDEFRLPPTS